MENFNKQTEKMIYVNVNQTAKEKILALKDNIFSTITNSNFLNVYDKKSYEELCEIIKKNDNILVASLPIFRFSEDGKNDDTAKVFSFSLGVVHNDYEHGKFELLTVNEIKEYLDKEVWIFIYSISDESYENTLFKWRTIILNKKSSKIDGNATEKEVNIDINKFSETFADDSKERIISKWEKIGFIDTTKTDKEKFKLAKALDFTEDYLHKDPNLSEYQTVVYPIIVRLNEKIVLNYTPIIQIIKDIKKEYQLCNKDKHDDFELKFVETFVDNYTKKVNKNKHLTALLEAIKTGEPNDQTKLMVGLSQLKTAGFKDYEGLDKDWLFSDYYQKCDNTLTNKEKEKKNEEAYQYFIENNIKTTEDSKVANNIDKLLNYLSEFYDNKNPYPLMYFSETFETNNIPKNNIGLTDKYLTAINHPIILELKDIYEKYKLDVAYANGNKYEAAKIHQMIDILISYYELRNFIKIDSKKCHRIANQILGEIEYDFNKFDVNVYMEKYVKARTYEIWNDFETLFVQQFIEFLGIRPQVKLF